MTKWDQLWFMQITLIFKSRDKKKIVNLKPTLSLIVAYTIFTKSIQLKL